MQLSLEQFELRVGQNNFGNNGTGNKVSEVQILAPQILAVELLRKPIWGQLKTITNKKSGFGGLRICTS